MSKGPLDSSFLLLPSSLPMTHGFWNSSGSSGLSFASFYWSSKMTEPWAVMALAPRSSTLSPFLGRPCLGGAVARLGRPRLGNQEPRDPG
jgi:hypothetical protein